ncbi:MAG: ATP synthase F1 subunit epsilon [Elusimicrobiota bacterium]
MKTIHVEVITPEKMIIQADVESVTVPAINGELCILPGHAHLIAQLQPGELKLKNGQDITSYAVSGGFLEVHPKKIEIYAESADLTAELSAERARQLKETANLDLQQGKNLASSQLALNRALAQLKVLRRVRQTSKRR